MTRIDAPQSGQAAGRKDVTQVIRRELFFDAFRRKVFGCGGCLIAFLIALLVPTVIVLVLLARSGLARVPLLSDWLYVPQSPVRIVHAFEGSTADDVYRAVSTRIKYDPRAGSASFGVTEGEATTVLSDAVAHVPAGTLPLPVRGIQVAFDPGEAELFATFNKDGRDVTSSLRFVPSVTAGAFDLDVIALHFGTLAVPHVIAQMLVTSAARYVASSVASGAGLPGTLSSVTSAKGELRFIIIPKTR